MNQDLATIPTGSRYSVNGTEMYVVIAGSGLDVLLLHGFPDSHKLWRYQIPALVAGGFRVIAPDQFWKWRTHAQAQAAKQ
jgi:pimeloyl-ACP methyl ester carboxylesterase